MANINPFLSKPDEWATELEDIKRQREKLDRREAHLKAKMSAFAKEKGIEDRVEVIVDYFERQRQTKGDGTWKG